MSRALVKELPPTSESEGVNQLVLYPNFGVSAITNDPPARNTASPKEMPPPPAGMVKLSMIFDGEPTLVITFLQFEPGTARAERWRDF
jgi:hypothetical protein